MTASSIYFQSLPYSLDPSTQLIDYEGLAKQARIFKPRLIICGASAYPRDWDYASLRKTADEHARKHHAELAKLPQDIHIADPGPDLMFDDRLYKRGALTVHALRLLLDDDAGQRTGTFNVSGHAKPLSAKYIQHPQMQELWDLTENVVRKWL